METKAYQPKFNSAKFKELMLYAAEKSQGDPRFGATKLNKILFFADFYSYGLIGRSLTGAHYQRLPNGPAPKELKQAEREIEQSQDGHFLARPYFNRRQRVLVPKRPVNLNHFSAEELDLVNDIIANLEELDATGVSFLSHERSFAWQIADEGEEIPYTAVFMSSRKPTQSDLRRGRELARKYEWLSSAR